MKKLVWIKLLVCCCAFSARTANISAVFTGNDKMVVHPTDLDRIFLNATSYRITKDALDMPEECFQYRKNTNLSEQMERYMKTGILEMGVDYYVPQTNKDTFFSTTLRIVEPSEDKDVYVVRDFTCQIASYESEYYSVFSRKLLMDISQETDGMRMLVNYVPNDSEDLDEETENYDTISNLVPQDSDYQNLTDSELINNGNDSYSESTTESALDYDDNVDEDTMNPDSSEYTTTVVPPSKEIQKIPIKFSDLAAWTNFANFKNGTPHPVVRSKNSVIQIVTKSSKKLRSRRKSEKDLSMYKSVSFDIFHEYGQNSIDNYWNAIKSTNNDTSFLTYLSNRINDMANLFPNMDKNKRERLLPPLIGLSMPKNNNLKWLEYLLEHLIFKKGDERTMLVKTTDKKYMVTNAQWKEIYAILDEWHFNVDQRLNVVRDECRSLSHVLFGIVLKELGEKEVFKCEKLNDEDEIIKCFQEFYYDRMIRSEHNQIILGTVAEIAVKIHRISVEKGLITNLHNAKDDLRRASSSVHGSIVMLANLEDSTKQFKINTIQLSSIKPTEETDYEYESTTTLRTSPNTTVATTTIRSKDQVHTERKVHTKITNELSKTQQRQLRRQERIKKDKEKLRANLAKQQLEEQERQQNFEKPGPHKLRLAMHRDPARDVPLEDKVTLM